jgi:hypothetical protein
MKLKKLLAAVLVAVMALTVAPLAASAAVTPIPTDRYISVTVGGKTVSTTAWNNGTGCDGTASSPFIASIDLTYASAQSGISFAYSSVPSGSSLTVSGNDASITNPATSGLWIDQMFSTKAGGTSSVLTFAVTNASAQTTYYALTVRIGAEPSYTITIGGGNGAGTASVSGGTPWNILNNVKENDKVTISAPSTNKSGYPFSYWQFNNSVKTAEASVDEKGNAVSSDTWVTKNGGEAVGNPDLDIYMPAGNVTATAYYTDGKTFTGSGSSNNNNVSGNGTVPVYFSGTTYDGLTYMNAGDSMTLYASNYYNYANTSYANVNWTVTPSGAGSFSNYNSPTTTFYLNTNYYGTVYVYAYGGQHSVTINSVTGGSAATNKSTANTGEEVILTASASGSTSGYDYSDPYYPLYGYGYGYQTYYYTFSSWSFSTAVTYASGYSATSNPTRIIMPNANLTVTPNFTYSSSGNAYNPYYPGMYYPTTGGSSSSTSTTYTSGGASSTIVSGGVIAGVNASGSLNSTSTVNAIEAGIQRGLLTGSTITVTLPEETTAISKATMEKLLRAAGGKSLRIKMDTDYGTIVIPVTSAKQIRTGITGNNSTIRSAVALFEKTYGNDDVTGVQTTQASTFGFSATYRFDAGAVGVAADYGDRVYVAIYNPSTKKFSRKTVTVNASGEIAFASSYSGVILFSTEPFTK